MEDIEFKFEPVWVSTLGATGTFFIYKLGSILFEPGFSFQYIDILVLLFILIVGILVLPMFFKMLIGIPAINLTSDQLIDNVVGIAINWKDIKDIRITGVSKPFLSITLNDKKAFFDNISNPFKRILFRIFFSIATGDVSINLAMVAGDNKSIKAMVMVQWSRYFGHYD